MAPLKDETSDAAYDFYHVRRIISRPSPAFNIFDLEQQAQILEEHGFVEQHKSDFDACMKETDTGSRERKSGKSATSIAVTDDLLVIDPRRNKGGR